MFGQILADIAVNLLSGKLKDYTVPIVFMLAFSWSFWGFYKHESGGKSADCIQKKNEALDDFLRIQIFRIYCLTI